MGIDTKKAFMAIYRVLIDKDHGPKAAWFLLSLPKDKVVKRLKEASK
jgi:lysyl-tRNA synthetase class I